MKFTLHVIATHYKFTGGLISRREYYKDFAQHPQFFDWFWLVIFIVISISNGWFLRVSAAPLPIVGIFAFFPLTYLVNELIDNPWVLNLSLLSSWLFIAFVIGNFKLQGITGDEIILYGLHTMLLVIVLLNVFSKTRYLLLFIFAIVTLLFLKITDWERSIRLIWYCNLMLSATNAGIRLSQYFQSFPKGMLILTTSAFLGISLGWFLSAKLG